MKAVKGKKIATFDGKPLVKVNEKISVPIEISNEATMMMHMDFAEGEYHGKKFSVIMSVGGAHMRLQFEGSRFHTDVRVKDLIDPIVPLAHLYSKDLKK